MSSANLNFDFRKIQGYLFHEKGEKGGKRKIFKKIMILLIR